MFLCLISSIILCMPGSVNNFVNSNLNLTEISIASLFFLYHLQSRVLLLYACLNQIQLIKNRY